MNILVIGNGFDVAHGLPTRYIDFIKFLKYFIYSYEEKNWNTESKTFYSLDEKIRKLIEDKINFKREDSIWIKFKEEVQNNVWTNFFINKIEDISEDDGWIDCEKEISEIIKAMDYKIKIVLFKNSHGEMEKKIINKVKDFKAREFLELYREKSDSKLSNYWEGNGREKFIKNLQKDLEGVIWCLKIYLMYIVDKIETNIKNKDIEGISNNIDAVLSFNYTDTYRKIYNNHRGH